MVGFNFFWLGKRENLLFIEWMLIMLSFLEKWTEVWKRFKNILTVKNEKSSKIMTYTQTLKLFSWIRFGIFLQIKAPLIGSWHQIPTIFNSLGLVNYKLSDPLPKIQSDIFKPTNFKFTELLVWKLNHVRHANYSQRIKSFSPIKQQELCCFLSIRQHQ